MAGLINLSWTICVLCGWLLYRYVKIGKPWYLFIITIGIIYTYLEYEGPLGIFTCWSILLILSYAPINQTDKNRISWRRWAGLWLPDILFVLYLFYRLYY